RFGGLDMLTIGHGIGKELVSLDAVFTIGQGVDIGSGIAPSRKTSISKRLQTLHQYRIESGFFGQLLPRGVLLNQLSEAHAHFFCYCFLLCKQVMSFAWIFAQIVKL